MHGVNRGASGATHENNSAQSARFFFAMVLGVSLAVPSTKAQDIFIDEPQPSRQLAQMGVDTSDIEAVKAAVESADPLLSSVAALYLGQKKVIEAIPRIVARFQVATYGPNSPDVFTLNYLRALKELAYNEVAPLLRAFVESVFANADPDWHDTYYEALEAIQILVELGDYSKFHVMNQVFENMEDEIESGYVTTFAAFAADASLREEIVTVLLRLLHNHKSEETRWSAAENLRHFTDFPSVQVALRRAAQDDIAFAVRRKAIEVLLDEYRDPLVIDILTSVLLTTTDRTEGFDAIAWLEKYDAPAVLIAFKQASELSPNESVRRHSRFSFDTYKPPTPEQQVSTLELLSGLIKLKHQGTDLNWLADKGLIDELDNHLDNAQKRLEKGDEKNASHQVAKFQEKVNFWRKKTEQDEKSGKPRGKRFVTIEGWKFLHFHAQYILDRLPGKVRDKSRKGSSYDM